MQKSLKKFGSLGLATLLVAGSIPYASFHEVYAATGPNDYLNVELARDGTHDKNVPQTFYSN